ncbi:hypothetical protein [Curtobacterium sp. L1-20]|uniref:hypothetical protein n=1 Tax=Curtobacterium sp. L1-20 TaxID=3138181 RepID=UPI003B52B10F
MTGHKLRLAALGARTRRMLRHTDSPVERALALVIVARAIADHAAGTTAAHRRETSTVELAGAERVLSAALEHLHTVRTDTYRHSTDSTHE